jgi:hypothetical protein
MPAGSRNAKPGAGRRRKPVGVAGTEVTPSPGGSINARRTPANRCECPRHWTNFPGTSRKTSGPPIGLILQDFPAHFPFRRKRPVRAWAILIPEQATMQLEFHQLDRRWEHLRVRQPHRQRHLMASLAESGQQTPIVVVLSPDHRDHYLVIDGYKRIAALRPQRELGVAALGAGRAAAGSDPAASTGRSAARRTGHEVSGAGGARQPGALRADGRRFRPAPLRHTASRATLCRLARRLARGPRAHPGRAGTVFENAAAAAGRQLDRGRTRSRTGPDGGANRKGTGSQPC